MKIDGACHCQYITYEAEVDPDLPLHRLPDSLRICISRSGAGAQCDRRAGLNYFFASTLSVKVIAELHRKLRIHWNELTQPLAPFNQWTPAQIGSIKEQKVEGKQHQAMRLSLDCRSQSCEVRNTLAVLHDDFTIDQ
jgi:hypothetical protein